MDLNNQTTPYCILHTSQDNEFYNAYLRGGSQDQRKIGNLHVQRNPQNIHINPAFYSPLARTNLSLGVPSITSSNPTNKKVIINPKFFPSVLGNNEKETELDKAISSVVHAPLNSVTPGSVLQVAKQGSAVTMQHPSNRYSWKKVDGFPSLDKVVKSPQVIKSRFKIIKVPTLTSTPVQSSAAAVVSRYKVDNRRHVSKKPKSLKSPRQLQAKYKLIGKSLKTTSLAKNSGSDTALGAIIKSRLALKPMLSASRMSSSFSNFRSPVASNRRSLLSWRPTNRRLNIKLLRSTTKIRSSCKKKIPAIPKNAKSTKKRKRYYEEEKIINNEEELKISEMTNVEDSEHSRIPRPPLGELPSFITL